MHVACAAFGAGEFGTANRWLAVDTSLSLPVPTHPCECGDADESLADVVKIISQTRDSSVVCSKWRDDVLEFRTAKAEDNAKIRGVDARSDCFRNAARCVCPSITTASSASSTTHGATATAATAATERATTAIGGDKPSTASASSARCPSARIAGGTKYGTTACGKGPTFTCTRSAAPECIVEQRATRTWTQNASLYRE